MAITYYSTSIVGNDVLPFASPEEQLAITRIFDPSGQKLENPKALAARICAAGGHAA